jgi:hypothetical protein
LLTLSARAPHLRHEPGQRVGQHAARDHDLDELEAAAADLVLADDADPGGGKLVGPGELVSQVFMSEFNERGRASLAEEPGELDGLGSAGFPEPGAIEESLGVGLDVSPEISARGP